MLQPTRVKALMEKRLGKKKAGYLYKAKWRRSRVGLMACTSPSGWLKGFSAVETQSSWCKARIEEAEGTRREFREELRSNKHAKSVLSGPTGTSMKFKENRKGGRGDCLPKS
jgi:hypothetical protein